MKRSVALGILVVIALAVALLIATRSGAGAQAYVDCASRVLSGASPTDSSPPANFRRLAPRLWSKRDLYLARVLARECTSEPRSGVGRVRHELFALGAIKSVLSSSQRESLAAVLLPAHGGRGITRSAQAEWGRPPADLSDSEMTWLFVVGQRPDCSKRLTTSERERQTCAQIFKSLSDNLHGPSSSAP
jgi:hypothetical protein